MRRSHVVLLGLGLSLLVSSLAAPAWARQMARPSGGSAPFVGRSSVQMQFLRAAATGDARRVREILGNPDVDVNVTMPERTNWQGSTALMLASQGGHADVVRVLLSHPRIDVNHVLRGRGRAIELAVRSRAYEITRLLVSHPRFELYRGVSLTENAIVLAAQQNWGDGLSLLLDSGSIHPLTLHTALFLAARFRDLDALAFLAPHPSVNINIRDRQGRTALMVAIEAGSIAAVEAILDVFQVDVLARDRQGRTALKLAEEKLAQVRGREPSLIYQRIVALLKSHGGR